MNHPRRAARRRLIPRALFATITLGAVLLGWPTAAYAHWPEISGQVVCAVDNRQTVTWTVVSYTAGTDRNMVIEAVTMSRGTVTGISVGQQVRPKHLGAKAVGTSVFPGSETGEVTLSVTATWVYPDGTPTNDSRRTRSATVTLPGECNTTTTTTTAPTTTTTAPATTTTTAPATTTTTAPTTTTTVPATTTTTAPTTTTTVPDTTTTTVPDTTTTTVPDTTTTTVPDTTTTTAPTTTTTVPATTTTVPDTTTTTAPTTTTTVPATTTTAPTTGPTVLGTVTERDTGGGGKVAGTGAEAARGQVAGTGTEAARGQVAGRNLARTGSPASAMSALAVVLLAAGIVLTRTSRRPATSGRRR